MGFSPSTVPAFAVSPKTEIVKGNPVCAWKTVASCQFEVRRRVRSERLYERMEYTALRAKRWRISQPNPFSASRSLLSCATLDSHIGDRKSGAFVRLFAHV